MLYQDDQYLLHLSRWDSASGAWTECYAGSELAQYMDMTSDGEELYFTYTTGSYPYVLYGASYDPATETVSVLGSATAQNSCNMEIEVAAGKVFVGYRDLDSNSVPKLAVFQGELWESTALSDQSCGSVSTLTDGDAVWILPTDGKNGVSRWENGAVTTYALPEGMKDRAFQMIPVVAEGKFYVAMNAQNPEEFPLYGLNLETGTWEQTGNGQSSASGSAEKYAVLPLHCLRPDSSPEKAAAPHWHKAGAGNCFGGHRSGWHMQSDRSGTLAAVSAEPEITDRAADGAC